MMKNSNFATKRSKSFKNNENISENILISKITSHLFFGEQSIKKSVPKRIEKKTKWMKKEEENLMISFFQIIIEEPFMNFSWEAIENPFISAKIRREFKKSSRNFSSKLQQLKSVNEQTYSDLDFTQFLLAYWGALSFKNKKGEALIQIIKKMQESRKEHMQMCDKMLGNLSQKQESFDELYNLIMKD